MTNLEKTLLLGMLEELSDIQSNATCNDYNLENTEENREFMRRVYEHQRTNNPYFDEEVPGEECGSRIWTNDSNVLDYLKYRLKETPAEDE